MGDCPAISQDAPVLLQSGFTWWPLSQYPLLLLMEALSDPSPRGRKVFDLSNSNWVGNEVFAATKEPTKKQTIQAGVSFLFIFV